MGCRDRDYTWTNSTGLWEHKRRKRRGIIRISALRRRVLPGGPVLGHGLFRETIARLPRTLGASPTGPSDRVGSPIKHSLIGPRSVSTTVVIPLGHGKRVGFERSGVANRLLHELDHLFMAHRFLCDRKEGGLPRIERDFKLLDFAESFAGAEVHDMA